MAVKRGAKNHVVALEPLLQRVFPSAKQLQYAVEKGPGRVDK